MTYSMLNPQRPARRAGLGVLACLVIALPACDFDVTNPGPIEDRFLDVEGAHWALVNGGGRALSISLAYLSYTGGVAAKELIGSGNITSHGVTLLQRDGVLSPASSETQDHYQHAQRARWISEEAVRRLRENAPDFNRYEPAAQALVHVGFANRLLGENMCVAVIDGGAAQSRMIYHQRAQQAFTEAIQVAANAGRSDLEMAARAGRASVRIWLDDWAEAVADASAVPADFEYLAHYYANNDLEHNRIYWAGASQPFRAASVYSTWFEDYYAETSDPRTPWGRDPQHATGDGSNIPFLRQLKYTSRTAPANLTTGAEMQLILAEAELRQNDWQSARTRLNALRGAVDQPPEETSGLDETWTLLWQERSIQLWLEGRQLGDRFRRESGGLPGTPVQDLSGRDVCFPIADSEINTNPNINGPNG
jgi:starch-binding outer membrane protein, SusD/RagB family